MTKPEGVGYWIRVFSCGVLWAAVQAEGEGTNTLVVNPMSPASVTGKDDLRQLQHLASGVGWEFEPNADTAAALKKIGVRTLRCINVDPLPGQFDEKGHFSVGQPDRLLAHFNTCREVGATPHIVIATGLHPDLLLTANDVKDRPSLMGMVPSGIYGPKDWTKFQNYCAAYFEYVLVAQHFPNAEFEVANEPDIGGSFSPVPPKPGNGSQALYEAYFNLYRNVALAAQAFEGDHPGLRVRLGGPAIAWAFTFKYGDFNWTERFLRDCGAGKVKLDFIGVHFYGNISSLDGAYPSNYPAFAEMLKKTLGWRDQYTPGVPLCLTEWGASYHTSNEPQSVVNGSSIGAAWAAAFLNAMLEGGVDAALYLTTTDLRQPIEGQPGAFRNVWGWPSLFVNPSVFGGAYPKTPCHVFDMVSRLAGARVEATRGERTLGCFASADRGARRLTLLVWNSGARIPEFGPPVETAPGESVDLRVREAGAFFGVRLVRVRRWQVSEGVSDAYAQFARGEPLDDAHTALKEMDGGVFGIAEGQIDLRFAAPPSSVSLLEVTPESRTETGAQ